MAGSADSVRTSGEDIASDADSDAGADAASDADSDAASDAGADAASDADSDIDSDEALRTVSLADPSGERPAWGFLDLGYRKLKSGSPLTVSNLFWQYLLEHK
jgi:hypothetical protein